MESEIYDASNKSLVTPEIIESDKEYEEHLVDDLSNKILSLSELNYISKYKVQSSRNSFARFSDIPRNAKHKLTFDSFIECLRCIKQHFFKTSEDEAK